MRVCKIYQFGHNYRLVFFNKRYRFDDSVAPELQSDRFSEPLSEEEIRRRSVYRSLKTLEHIFYSNEFDYFVTITISPSVCNERGDYVAVRSLLTEKLNRLTKLYRGIQYILVPDYHADGAYHFHGFFKIPDSCRDMLRRAGSFRIFKAGGRAPKYYCPLLNKLFGRNEFRPMMSLFGKKSLQYVLKYVRKAAYEIDTQGKTLYVRSRNLVEYTSIETYEGEDACILESFLPDLGLKWYDYDLGVSVVPSCSEASLRALLSAYFYTLTLDCPLSPFPLHLRRESSIQLAIPF